MGAQIKNYTIEQVPRPHVQSMTFVLESVGLAMQRSGCREAPVAPGINDLFTLVL